LATPTADAGFALGPSAAPTAIIAPAKATDRASVDGICPFAAPETQWKPIHATPVTTAVIETLMPL